MKKYLILISLTISMGVRAQTCWYCVDDECRVRKSELLQSPCVQDANGNFVADHPEIPMNSRIPGQWNADGLFVFDESVTQADIDALATTHRIRKSEAGFYKTIWVLQQRLKACKAQEGQ